MKFQRPTSVKFLGDPVMQDMSDIPFNVKGKCCIWSALEQRRTHNASWTFLGFWRQHIPLWHVCSLGPFTTGPKKLLVLRYNNDSIDQKVQTAAQSLWVPHTSESIGQKGVIVLSGVISWDYQGENCYSTWNKGVCLEHSRFLRESLSMTMF